MAWTHVTQESFNSMRSDWVTAWSRKRRLTSAEHRVLRELAFKVDFAMGVAYPSQDYLAERLDVVRKTVNRAIKRLQQIGAIEVLSEAERLYTLGRMNNYVVRFDRVPTDDGHESGPFYLSLLEPITRPEIATHSEQGCPTNVPAMSHQCPTDTSYTKDKDLEVLRTSAGEASGKGRTNVQTKAQRKAQAYEDSVGDSTLGSDWGQQEEIEIPGLAEALEARGGKKRTQQAHPDSPMGLALHFRDSLVANDWQAFDLKGVPPLRKWISEWLKAGTSPDTIRTMIRLYTTDEGLRSSRLGQPPWKDFVYKRYLLEAEARRQAEATDRADAWTSEAPEERGMDQEARDRAAEAWGL